jgi:hypothetical protein
MTNKILAILFCLSPLLAYGEDAQNASDFGFDKQKQYDVIYDDMNSDPFFNSKPKNSADVKPAYEFGIEAGAFVPNDASTFNTYYTKKPIFVRPTIARLYWAGPFGFGFGLSGIYITSNNGGKYVVDPNNSLNIYEHEFYAYGADGVFEIHFRPISFLFIQPSLFGSAGLIQLEDTATPYDTSLYNAVRTSETSQLYTAGGHVDISLTAFAQKSSIENSGSTIADVIFRGTGAYGWNRTLSGMSLTGAYFSAGLVFLIN